MGLFDHRQYLEMTMHFRCNLKCVHCMIEGTMDRLTPESDESFREVLEHNQATGRWSGIVFTGSEITLRRDLPELARQAREHGFQHVRIQTHGMRLADRHYCEQLIEAGVDQYFISVCAADAATHDAITEVPGSFEKTLRGLEVLDSFEDVVTMTNTVITKLSYRQLPDLVERLGRLKRLVQMDFWSYWPMSEVDEKDLLVPFTESIPYLREALAKARALGRAVEVKNVPECLLGSDRNALCNDQPQLFIDQSFWTEFERNGFHECLYREHCTAKQCLGLNAAYTHKYGWEASLLQPFMV